MSCITSERKPLSGLSSRTLSFSAGRDGSVFWTAARYDPGIAEQWSSGIPVISHQAIARHHGVSRQQKRAHCSRTQAPAEIPKAERDSREHRVGHRLIEGGERNTHPPLKPAGQGDSLICAGLLLPAFRPLGQCVKWLAS